MNYYIEKHDMKIILDALDIHIVTLEQTYEVCPDKLIVKLMEDAKNLAKRLSEDLCPFFEI